MQTKEQYDFSVVCKNNPKKFWSYVNSKRKTISDIGELAFTDEHGQLVFANTDEFKAEVLHRVPKKHVTTFSTITLTIGVRLQ